VYDDPRPEQPLPRGPTSQPYRGPRRTHRATGRVEVWVEGSGYVPEDSLSRLTVQERNAVIEARDRARNLREMLPQLRRFEELNTQEGTGSVGQIVGQTLNIPPLLGREREQEMAAIINRLTPRQRQGMPGAASDRDVAMFRGSLPNLQRVGPANSQIIRNLEREAAESQAYAEYLDWYWPRHGTTAGAEESWTQYTRADPNLGRGWRSYFEGGGQGQSGPPRIANAADYQRLPSGAEYIDPSGVRRRKP